MAQQDSGTTASQRRTSGTGQEEPRVEPQATRTRGRAKSGAKQTGQPGTAGKREARSPRTPAESRARRRAGESARAPQPEGQAQAETAAVTPAEAAGAALSERPEEIAGAVEPAAVGRPIDVGPSLEAAAEAQAEEELASLGPMTEPPAAGAEAADGEPLRRRDRRVSTTNALGIFIERQFANPTSPCHSYSDLERHSGISREALSRYVTSRVDRRRSPTIDTLVAIADTLHVGLEPVSRAAAASVKGVIPPPEEVQYHREEVVSTLIAALTDAQFDAVVELLRQMHPQAS